MIRRSLSLVVALATLSSLAAIAAAKPSIAILGLEVKESGGTIDEKATTVASELTDALRARAQIATSPYSLAPDSNKELLELKLLSDCGDETPKCMAQMGDELSAEHLLYGRITKRKDGYQVSLDLLDVKKKSMVRSTSELIPFSETSAAGLQKWGRSLYNRLTGVSDEGTLVIRANVDKGTVYVDGELKTTLQAGSARITGLSAGPHTVGVESDGYETYAGEVDIKAGDDSNLDVAMKGVGGGVIIGPGGGERPGGGGRPGGASRALFWTSLVLTGAGAAAVTVTGLQVRGSLKDDQLAAIETLANRPTNPIKLDKDNACSDAATHPDDADAMAVVSACDTGRSRATLTNVFLGATVVTAVAASYFYYKGFIAPKSSSRSERARRAKHKRGTSITLVPSVSPTTVGAGVAIEF